LQENFVLIDYENVQPTDLAPLRGGPLKVKVFLGAHQSKISVAQNSSASLHIVSKDTGFDPLIKHLHSKGVEARRSASVPNVSSLKPARPSTTDARIDTVVAHLKKPKATKPGSKKSLFNLLRALYKKEGLTEDQLSALFASLCERGIVKLDGSKITYDLPDGH
jgi:hypothetical protein